MNPPAPERKKCPNPCCTNGKVWYNSRGGSEQEDCPTCKGTGLAIEPETDYSIKAKDVKPIPRFATPEPVSEKTLGSPGKFGQIGLSAYFRWLDGRHDKYSDVDQWDFIYEAIASHIRETVYRDEVKPLIKAAELLSEELKHTRTALAMATDTWLEESEAIAAYQVIQKGTKP